MTGQEFASACLLKVFLVRPLVGHDCSSKRPPSYPVKLGIENQALKDRNAALEATNNTNMDTIAQRSKKWNVGKEDLLQKL